MKSTREKLIEFLNSIQQKGLVYTPSQMDDRYGTTREISNAEVADHLIANGVEIPVRYNEIIELHKYCEKIGLHATLEELFDGYAIRFPSGADFIQHCHSYGAKNGCVEPAIGSRLDYTPIPLRNAKELVKRHRDKLNRRAEDGK